MPVPSVISTAANSFRLNQHFVGSSVKDLSDEEWLRRPNSTTNHVAWIVGHLIWSRKATMVRLGHEWSKPWLSKFARGVKLEEAAPFPSRQELMDAWQESAGALEEVLGSVADSVLAQPAPNPGPPTADGKMSGFVDFMAVHETYHAGQLAYLCTWLGHKGPMG